MKLCYCRESWAFFTDQPLNKQWGDDWNNAPYEHNAGYPYSHDGEIITKVAWDGDFDLPGNNAYNSSYSVERINQGVIPWLVTSKWIKEPVVVINAGTSYEDFVRLIHEGGGNVYTKITGVK